MTELSVVVPVFKEGEAVEPVLRALDAGVATPHEILVVYDFDEDPTVPVIDRLHAELPAIRGLRNDLGRGVLNAMKAGIAASTGDYVLVSMADGSDEPQVVDRDGGARAGRRRRRLGVALHEGRPPGRRAAAQAPDEPDRRTHAPLVRRRRDPRPDQQLQALLAPVPRRDDDRERGRLRARPRADGQGDARSPPRRRGPHDLARPDRRPEQLQAPQVAAALPALVLVGDARVDPAGGLGRAEHGSDGATRS